MNILTILFSFCLIAQAEESNPVSTFVSEKTSLNKESNLESSLFGNSPYFNQFVELGLEYPINFGVQLKSLFYNSYYVRLGFGFMSNFFLSSFKHFSPFFGYLKEEEASLLSDTFMNSIYLDLRLGWTPYYKETGGGPYLEVGFSNTLLGKGELKGANIAKVIRDVNFDETKNYSAKTTTYNATFHVGYSIPFENIKLNFEAGLVKILHTSIMDLEKDQIGIGLEEISKKQ